MFQCIILRNSGLSFVMVWYSMILTLFGLCFGIVLCFFMVFNQFECVPPTWAVLWGCLHQCHYNGTVNLLFYRLSVFYLLLKSILLHFFCFLLWMDLQIDFQPVLVNICDHDHWYCLVNPFTTTLNNVWGPIYSSLFWLSMPITLQCKALCTPGR